MKTKNSIRIVVATALILMVPLVAMQFTDEVDWGVADFVIVGSLLVITGLVYEQIANRVSNTGYRIVFSVILLALLLLVWADLAVGIFNTPFSGH